MFFPLTYFFFTFLRKRQKKEKEKRKFPPPVLFLTVFVFLTWVFRTDPRHRNSRRQSFDFLFKLRSISTVPTILAQTLREKRDEEPES